MQTGIWRKEEGCSTFIPIVWSHQVIDASLRETCQLCKRNGHDIKGQGQRLPVEIAATQHITLLWEDKRIIGYGSQLTLEYSGTIFQSVTHSSKNLRGTAQGVGVLHTRTISMAVINLAVTHQL